MNGSCTRHVIFVAALVIYATSPVTISYQTRNSLPFEFGWKVHRPNLIPWWKKRHNKMESSLSTLQHTLTALQEEKDEARQEVETLWQDMYSSGNKKNHSDNNNRYKPVTAILVNQVVIMGDRQMKSHHHHQQHKWRHCGPKTHVYGRMPRPRTIGCKWLWNDS
jgi:hypothetical protein